MDCTTLDTRSPRRIWSLTTVGSSCSSRSTVGSWWNPLSRGSWGVCSGGSAIGAVPLTATSMMLHNGGVLGTGGSMEHRAKPGRGEQRRSVSWHVLDGRTRIKNFSRLLLPWARSGYDICHKGGMIPCDTQSGGEHFCRKRIQFLRAETQILETIKVMGSQSLQRFARRANFRHSLYIALYIIT